MNALKLKYGLEGKLTKAEWFWEKPCIGRLRSFPKELQTTEMIEAAISNYGKTDGSILRHTSKRALNYELRKRALELNGADLTYISKRDITEELARIAVGNCWWALQWVPKELISMDILKTALSTDGRALKFAPEEMKSFEICLLAVANDRGDDMDHAIREVPADILLGGKGRELCEAAVSANGLALMGVPDKFITSQLARVALERDSGGWMNPVIKYIPSKVMSRDLVELSFSLNPGSIASMPPHAEKFVTKDMCIKLIDDDPSCVCHIPEKFLLDKKVADFALEKTPRALEYIPEKLKTRRRCFAAKERSPEEVSVNWFPEKVRLKWEAAHREEKADPTSIEPFKIDIITDELPYQDIALANCLACGDVGRLAVHHFDDEPAMPRSLYYVSDIHLEHQIAFGDCATMADAKKLIRNKVDELLEDVPVKHADVLLGGDIANNVALASLFYETLAEASRDRGHSLLAISVFGNHELWEAGRQGHGVEDIFSDHRDALKNICENNIYFRGTILENSLYVLHKGSTARVIEEIDILESSSDDLKELCEESTLMVLGGLGFSGLNPKFNANMGLYRLALDREEDIARSARFKAVHDRLLECASDERVIVLTHTPVSDWLDSSPNPNWIYINGHTHQNGMLMEDDGTTVLFDNQVGYESKKWHFNSIELEVRYNPFEKWEDGIHEISAIQYRDFNRGRGICSEFKRAGRLYVAKRSGLYMFFFEKQGRCYMLEGGRIHTIEHPMSWYFDNIPEYAERVRLAFRPYQNALRKISEEIRSFGGYGIAHGCIVDIDFFNHIYLNPFDGAITPYFAWDMDSRVTFESMEGLLAHRALAINGRESDHMLQEFAAQDEAGNLALLSKRNSLAKRNESLVIPEDLTDRSMYAPSRIMRSIQYLFDDDVIRVWRDSVLDSSMVEGRGLSDESSRRAGHRKLPDSH